MANTLLSSAKLAFSQISMAAGRPQYPQTLNTLNERNSGIRHQECSNRPKGSIFKRKAFSEQEIYRVPKRICKGFFPNRHNPGY